MKIMCIALLLLLTVIGAALNDKECKKLHFLPMPRNISCGEQKFELADPCKILFHVKLKEDSNSHVEELIAFQMKKTLSCHVPNVIIAPEINMNV